MKKKSNVLREIGVVEAEMFVLSRAEQKREGLGDQAEIECLAGRPSARKENSSVFT